MSNSSLVFFAAAAAVFDGLLLATLKTDPYRVFCIYTGLHFAHTCHNSHTQTRFGYKLYKREVRQHNGQQHFAVDNRILTEAVAFGRIFTSKHAFSGREERSG